MTAELLPNGQQQFIDSDGAPYAAGLVYFYIPETSTLKDTYSDQALTTLNTNPVVLDAAGRATIWGEGLYRQLLKDADGNTIWDKVVGTEAAADSGITAADVSFTQSGSDAVEITLDDYFRNNIFTLEMFGATGDGVADDLPALIACATQAAIAKGTIVGRAGATYRLEGQFLPPSWFVFDLGGATLLPVYTDTSFAILHSVPSLATYAVTTQNANSNSVTLGDVSGLNEGDLVRFAGPDVGGYKVFPPSYSYIKHISVLTLTLGNIIPFAYDTPTTMEKVTFDEAFTLRNGYIDCSEMGPNVGGLMNIAGYNEQLVEELVISGVDFEPTDLDYIMTMADGLSLRVRDVRYADTDRNGNYVVAWRFASALIDGIEGSGDGFGVSAVNCDYIDITNNELHGAYYSGGLTSVRGIKVIGHRSCTISGNRIAEYESGMKIEDTSGTTIYGNHIEACGGGINVSNLNPNVRWGRHAIVGNIIRDTRGSTGIFASDILAQALLISGNIITDCQQTGITARGNQLLITGNIIKDWSQSGPGYNPVFIDNAATTGRLDGNHAETNNPSTANGWWIDTTQAFSIGQNTINTDAPWATKPASTLTTEVTREMGMGGLMLKTVVVAGVTGAYANFSFPTPFPLGLMAIVSARPITPAVAGTVVSVDDSACDKTKVNMKANNNCDVLVTAIGW